MTELDSDELVSIRAERQRKAVSDARQQGRAEGALLLAIGIVVYVIASVLWHLAVTAICGG